MALYSDFDVIILQEHCTQLNQIIEKQKELLDVQRDLIKLLMSGQYNPIIPKPVDPNKWEYDPGPTCGCEKRE